MANNEYDFHFVPLEGKLPGLKLQKQTEDAINDIGNRLVQVEENSEATLDDAQQAVEKATEAIETANNADTKAQTALDEIDTFNPKTHFIGVNSSGTEDSNYNGGGAVGTDSISIGKSASATAEDSIAIGKNSVATTSGEVSIGVPSDGVNAEVKRKITHVADGVADSDAVSKGQMDTAIGSPYTAGNGIDVSSGRVISAVAGTNITVDSSGINAPANGSIASGDTGLLGGGTAYTELHVTKDGSWVKGTNTTAQNLEALEGGVEYAYAILSRQYDQLKKYVNGNYYDYDTDDDEAYTKSVPAGALPYAGLEKVGGKTVVMNQLVDYTSIASSGSRVGKIDWVNNNDGSFTFTGNSSAQDGNSITFATIPINHKYAVVGWTNPYHLGIFPNGQPVAETDGIFTQPNNNPLILRSNTADLPDNVSITLKPKIADLTLMYGSGNEPSTVEEFESMFPADYYEYNAGTLLSAGVTSVVSQGYNLFDKSTAVLDRFINGNNISAPSTNGAHSDYIAVSPSQTYFLSANKIDGRYRWFEYDTNKNFIGMYSNPISGAFTVGSRTCYIRFNTLPAELDTCVFNVSSTTNGTYKPYKAPIQYPIPTAIRNLEGYGWSAGTAYNYVDFERKVFVQNVGSVDLGTLNWTRDDTSYDYAFFVCGVSEIVGKKTGSANILSAHYITTDARNNMTTDKMCSRYNSTTSTRVVIRDDTYTDASTFTTAMDGVYLYYELATPIETDISQYLTDDNLIQVESGGTLTFQNSNGTDYQIPVPSEETYMVDLQASLGG